MSEPVVHDVPGANAPDVPRREGRRARDVELA